MDYTGGKFGPFSGQMFVGELNHATLMRVMLEEVNQQLQGAVVPFLNGDPLRQGGNRLAFAPDGSLWMGHTDHGWGGDAGITRITSQAGMEPPPGSSAGTSATADHWRSGVSNRS